MKRYDLIVVGGGLSGTCAAIAAARGGVKVLLVDNLILGRDYSMSVILVISLTLVATVILAKFIGCSLPIIAKRIGFDPAIMASPLITTIVDALSLVLYFQIAVMILNI